MMKKRERKKKVIKITLRKLLQPFKTMEKKNGWEYFIHTDAWAHEFLRGKVLFWFPATSEQCLASKMACNTETKKLTQIVPLS